MTKPMAYLILLLVAILLYTWIIKVPSARNTGYKEGVEATTDTLRPVIDRYKVKAQLWRELLSADSLKMEHTQLIIDSLDARLKAPHDDHQVYPVVPSVDAMERRERILKGADDLLGR